MKRSLHSPDLFGMEDCADNSAQAFECPTGATSLSLHRQLASSHKRRQAAFARQGDFKRYRLSRFSKAVIDVTVSSKDSPTVCAAGVGGKQLKQLVIDPATAALQRSNFDIIFPKSVNLVTASDAAALFFHPSTDNSIIPKAVPSSSKPSSRLLSKACYEFDVSSLAIGNNNGCTKGSDYIAMQTTRQLYINGVSRELMLSHMAFSSKQSRSRIA